jgi:CHAT domain-containing protein
LEKVKLSLKSKSTLSIRLAGLISFLLICFQHSAAQSLRLKNEIDSLLIQAGRLQFQNFGHSDSLYEVASRKILEMEVESDPVLWIRVLHQRSFTALFHSKLSSAKKYLDESYKSIDLYRNVLSLRSDSLKAQSQVIESNYYYAIGSYANALAKMNAAETFFLSQKQTPLSCVALYQILQFQGSIYYLQGEFESCIDRYLGSIQYYDCLRPEKSFPNYVLVHRNVAQAYAKMGSLKNAHRYFLSAKANLDSCPEAKRTFTLRTHAVLLHTSLGEFYRTQNKIDSAKYFFHQALYFLGNDPIYAGRINDGLAKVALAEKDYTTAHSLFKKSLKQIIHQRGEKYYLTAALYRSISSLHQEQGNFKNSLIFIQKALSSLSSSEELDTIDYTKNPSLRLLYMPKEMVMTLHQKATLLTALYNHDKNDDILLAARNTNLLAIQLLDSTRNDFSLEKDKVVLGEEAAKIYQTGLYIASLLFNETTDPKYLSECFELMDRSRSAVLMDHLKLVKTFSGIPAELQSRERELKVELTEAEEQLYDAETKNEETGSHRQHFGEIKKAYTTLLTDIKTKAPNYYKLRIEDTSLNLEETQSMLAQDEALVEYFLSDSILYIAVITPAGSRLYTTPVDSIRQQVESLRTLLANPAKLRSSDFQTRWKQRTQYLSQKLVEPWIANLTNTKRLIVIPHDVLNYLPFEMLPTNASGNILLNSMAISYASSANLLREQKNMRAAGNFFGGFNADYSNHKDLPQLVGAASEVNSIKDIFGFRSSLFSAATADDFRKEASQYKIIHLALHSLVNDEKPMFSRLVFTQKSENESADITANELYSMELNAEIAVLSACETGLGKLQRGEGMMSLSRAFMYAGVPSTVISLWKVPDQSASILMTKFYEFLKAGNKKDEALQLAKLEFIKEHPEMSHPFFWAGFIVNGKTDVISFSYFSSRELWLIATTCGTLLLIVIFIYWQRKKKQAIALVA